MKPEIKERKKLYEFSSVPEALSYCWENSCCSELEPSLRSWWDCAGGSDCYCSRCDPARPPRSSHSDPADPVGALPWRRGQWGWCPWMIGSAAGNSSFLHEGNILEGNSDIILNSNTWHFDSFMIEYFEKLHHDIIRPPAISHINMYFNSYNII